MFDCHGPFRTQGPIRILNVVLEAVRDVCGFLVKRSKISQSRVLSLMRGCVADLTNIANINLLKWTNIANISLLEWKLTQ